ncbi:MAG: twin-arginine translocase subunit TatC [Bdellovibrionales bacterium]|nr:twin-arginine translocase subunit TatC [Bdellovibrionales bacterium]
MDKKDFTFSEHLSELRDRMIKVLICITLGFIVSYFFSEFIISLITKPISPYLSATEGKLIFISPFEKFFSYLMVSLFSSFVISSPFWFYHIWKFISPGLYKKEKKRTLLFSFSSFFLFISGIFFVYFIVYPLSFRFLFNFGGEEIPYISLKPYLSFFLRTAFIFGFVFELPIFLIGILNLNILSPKDLKKARPYVITSIAVLSAIITPPDVFSMLFMMLPLYLLFEISLWIGQKFFYKN